MALLALLLAGAWPAWPQPGGPGPQGHGRRGIDQPMPQRPMPPPDRGRQDRPGDAPGGHRWGHLSPEERQELRRDISNHGRDIYRDRPGKGPRQR
jgi:hypothetical protein